MRVCLARAGNIPRATAQKMFGLEKAYELEFRRVGAGISTLYHIPRQRGQYFDITYDRPSTLIPLFIVAVKTQ